MQHDLEELVAKQYSCSVKIIYVDPGKEPMMLLAHVRNSVLYRLTPEDTASQSVTYQIRIEPRSGTLRAYEIQLAKEIHFTSDDVFLIETPDVCSLWIGKAALQFRDRISGFLDSNFPSLEWDTIEQDTIESEKWLASLSSTLNIHPRGPFDIHLTSSRLFRCCCSLGYFSIEEITGFGQEDLREDTCCLLDIAPLNKLFLWRGREASDVVLSLTLKSISLRWTQESSTPQPKKKATHTKSKDYDYFSDSDDRVVQTQTGARKSLEGGAPAKMKRHPTSRAKSISDVSELMPKEPGGEGSFVFVDQGKEMLDFTCYFHGWDGRLFQIVEPSNYFLDSIGKKRASH
jgi:hypothetical protein